LRQDLLAGGSIRFAWSPDSRRLAILEDAGLAGLGGPIALPACGATGGGNLAILDLDNGATRVINDPSVISEMAWSLDGRLIAAVGLDPCEELMATSIAVVDAAQARIVGRFEASASDPTWSPDGRWIGYLTQSDPYGLGVVDLTSGTVRQLTQGSFSAAPQWSQDSAWIILATSRVAPDVDPVDATNDGIEVGGSFSYDNAAESLGPGPQRVELRAIRPDGTLEHVIDEIWDVDVVPTPAPIP
jgi:Tol biopolymer transport system component